MENPSPLEKQSFLLCFVLLWIWQLERLKFCSSLCRKLPASCFVLLFGSFYGFLSPSAVTKKRVTAAERLPPPRCVAVCPCVACGSVVERERLGTSPSHPQPLQGASRAGCSVPERQRRSRLFRGQCGRPRPPGAVRDLFSIKIPCKCRAAAAEPSAWAEPGSQCDSLGEGCEQGCSGSSLCQTKLVWGYGSELPCCSTSGYGGQVGTVSSCVP